MPLEDFLLVVAITLVGLCAFHAYMALHSGRYIVTRTLRRVGTGLGWIAAGALVAMITVIVTVVVL